MLLFQQYVCTISCLFECFTLIFVSLWTMVKIDHGSAPLPSEIKLDQKPNKSFLSEFCNEKFWTIPHKLQVRRVYLK